MNGAGRWRDACVTRARTVAAGVRLIELAVRDIPPFMPGAQTRIVVDRGYMVIIGMFPCLPVEPGYVRVIVRERGDHASRFMWALVEGARVRLTKPERQARRHGAPQGRIGRWTETAR